jgi:hypothetical protein
MRSLPNGDVVIEHREYLADVLGSVGFASASYPMNPGLSKSFPWLSTIARRFESYVFEELEMIFETQAPTTSTGGIFIVQDFDASDAAPTDKVSAMSYRSAVRGPPWSPDPVINRAHGEDLHKLKSRYVRSVSALAANQDIKMYDVSNCFVCTQGQASTAAIGELYVHYRVKLMTPQSSPGQIPVWKAAVTAGLASNAIFGSARTLSEYNNIELTVNSTSTITFDQPFEGMVVLSFNSNQGALSAPGIGAGTATVTMLGSNLGASGWQASIAWLVKASAGQTFAPTLTITASGAGEIRITAYPYAAL